MLLQASEVFSFDSFPSSSSSLSSSPSSVWNRQTFRSPFVPSRFFPRPVNDLIVGFRISSFSPLYFLLSIAFGTFKLSSSSSSSSKNNQFSNVLHFSIISPPNLFVTVPLTVFHSIAPLHTGKLWYETC